MKRTYTRKELVAELAERGYIITFQGISKLINGHSVVSNGKKYTYPPRLILGVDYYYDYNRKYNPITFTQSGVKKIIQAIRPIKQQSTN